MVDILDVSVIVDLVDAAFVESFLEISNLVDLLLMLLIPLLTFLILLLT